MTTFFAGFIIGFIRGWQLALLLIAVTPFMVAGAAVFSKVREEGIEVDAHKIVIYTVIIISRWHYLI